MAVVDTIVCVRPVCATANRVRCTNGDVTARFGSLVVTAIMKHVVLLSIKIACKQFQFIQLDNTYRLQRLSAQNC